MNASGLKDATALIQPTESTMPSGIDQITRTIVDLDELLLVLSRHVRLISAAIADLPENSGDLVVNEIDVTVSPEVVCNQVAIHLQAAATGIDQARTAVRVAHQLSGRLRSRAR